MSQYVGRRIVPTHGGVWDAGKNYEELTIVLFTATGDSYISRRPVPAGTSIQDTAYWMLYSLWSEQVTVAEQHLKETADAIRKEMDANTRKVNQSLSDTTAAIEKGLKETTDSVGQGNEGTNLITLYSNVRSTPVRWLWYPYIAIGKITLLQGDPGDGKSTMMMNLIAELSNGGKTPDGRPIGPAKKVLYQCSEDGVADTIKPRLERCGANCENVAFIDEETHMGLTLDDDRLRDAIITFRPSLVVIDPIQAYLESDADLQIAGRARKLMHRLGLWASTYDCAIVIIGHLNKKEGSKGLYRSLGSIDVVAAARSVLHVERDEDDPDIRTVHQIKNSLAPSNGEFRFEIRPATGFRWINAAKIEIPDYAPKEPEFNSKTDKAAYWIKKLLESQDLTAKEMYYRLQEKGISHRTAEETRKAVGVRCYRRMRQWYWSLLPEE